MVGETRFSPCEFALPQVQAKTGGELILEAKIGDTTHADCFPFHIFPAAKPLAGKVAVFDPQVRLPRCWRIWVSRCSPGAVEQRTF